jgi:hypothetical protein
MFRTKTVTLVLAAAVVLSLTACGGGDTTNDTTNEQAADATRDDDGAAEDAASPGGEVDLEDAKSFVKVTACDGAPTQPIGVTATLKVTNTLDEPIEYYGSINFRDASGAVLTEGVFNTGTIEPGAKATEEIPGANVYEAVPEVTCELIEVKADNPT